MPVLYPFARRTWHYFGFLAFGWCLAGLLLGASAPARAQASSPVPASLLGQGVQQVVGGDNHSCALTTAGAVYCWGSNVDGQLGTGSSGSSQATPQAVTGLGGGVAAITAGGSHACALTTNGAVQCWGLNNYGQLGNGSSGSHRAAPQGVTGLGSGVAAIASGYLHTCALTTDGAVQCWGRNNFGQLGNGTNTNSDTPQPVTTLGSGVAAIALGGLHSCVLTTAGAVQCWGWNFAGQVGNGNSTDQNTPQPVTALASVAAITAGDAHSCALTTAGAVKCWGYNYSGQLGIGSTGGGRTTPQPVANLGSGVAAIRAGVSHTCARTESGAMQCWGNNGSGQLGNGSTTNSNTPQPVTNLAGGVAAIAAHGRNSCALSTAGALQCWGANNNGQVGNGNTTDQATPQAVIPLASGVVATASGVSHTCGLTTSGAVYCWGDGQYGQLGDGNSGPGVQSTTPQAVPSLTRGVKAIAAGYLHTCALTTAGAVQCWGSSEYGQLGNGSSGAGALSDTPQTIIASGVAAVGASYLHTCTLTTAGAVRCWGYNANGQLGTGTTNNSDSPQTIIASGVTAITLGDLHTCARTGGALQCWGGNSFGQLGDGTKIDRLTPTPVAASLGGNVTAVAAGGVHTCALTGGVTPNMVCWGRNNNGQLGRGPIPIIGFDPESDPNPQPVRDSPSDVAAMALGGSHTCVRTTTGAVRCWGENFDGQLGNGNNTKTGYPQTVGVTGQAAGIHAGVRATCMVTTEGGLQCWGGNYSGELGNGTTASRNAPTSIAAGQTIAFTPITSGAATTGTTLSAISSSGLPVVFDTWTPSVCTASGNTLTVLQPTRLCGVRALQAGGPGANAAYYQAAPAQMQLVQTAAGVPGAPMGLAATPGGQVVTLSWTAPAADNGSPISGYTVQVTPSGGSASVGCTTTGALTCAVTGLTNGVVYSFTVAAANAAGTGAASGAVTSTPQGYSNPGLTLPSGGGGGGGTADVQIPNLPAGCSVTSAQFSNTLPADLPAGAKAPLGVFSFTASGAGCGNAALNLRITYPAGRLAGLQAYKHGPPTAGAAASWFALGSIAGDVASFTVTDNGVGDSNPALGQIADPFAPLAMTAATAIPTLGEWGLMLLALLAAAVGARGVRRQAGV